MILKELRRLYNLSQRELSEVTGIPLRTIQSYDCGARVPADYMIDLIKTKLQTEYNTLQLITQQEAGIVLYGENAIVCNWSFFVNGGIPSIFPTGELMAIPKPLNILSKRNTDSVYDIIKDCEPIFDRNDDITALSQNDVAGVIYEISDGSHTVTVIAPMGWQ